MLRLLIAFIFCMVGLFQPDAMSCVSTSGIASEFDVHTICNKTTRRSFVPAAMIKEGRSYSILTDQLGTPTEAYDADGNEVWSRVLDMDGNVIKETGNKGMVPFLFQGQYYDRETGLAYNRFRYYSPQMGMYVSQDPIGLAGGILNLYGYVNDTNAWVDVWGLFKSYDKAANQLGYDKTNQKSHGQPIYKRNDSLKGKNKPQRPKTAPKYISPDIDSHNGGIWKGASSIPNLGSRQTRLGTYDGNLNRIGD